MILPPEMYGREELAGEAPEEALECPITHELMSDPVVAADGHTYERAAIQRSLDTGNMRHP